MDYRPWTWKIPENYHETQRAISRQDAHERVSGKAVYTRDVSLPGMLYAKILTSPYAHARIVSIDSSAAEALPGVRDILRYNDPDIRYDSGTGAWYEMSGNYNILTLPGVSDFYQHPMGVAVVSDSEEVCDRALRLMKIQWEERPFILDMEESVKPDAPKIMAEVLRTSAKAREPNTVLAEEVEIGDVDKGFAEADAVLEYKITREMNSAAGVEPAVCVAQWRGDFLDLWVHHQDIPQWSWCSLRRRGKSPCRRSLNGRRSPSPCRTRDRISGDFHGWPIPAVSSGSPSFWRAGPRGGL